MGDRPAGRHLGPTVEGRGRGRRPRHAGGGRRGHTAAQRGRLLGRRAPCWWPPGPGSWPPARGADDRCWPCRLNVRPAPRRAPDRPVSPGCRVWPRRRPGVVDGAAAGGVDAPAGQLPRTRAGADGPGRAPPVGALDGARRLRAIPGGRRGGHGRRGRRRARGPALEARHLGRRVVPADRPPRVPGAPPDVHGHVAANPSPSSPCCPSPRCALDVTGLPVGWSILVVSALTGATAVYGVGLLARRLRGTPAGGRPPSSSPSPPGTFAFSLGYSEGIVVTCVALGPARPPAAPVVAGRPARRRGHRRLAGGAGLRGELRLVRRVGGGEGAPLAPCWPPSRAARVRGLHGLPPGAHGALERLAPDRTGRVEELSVRWSIRSGSSGGSCATRCRPP